MKNFVVEVKLRKVRGERPEDWFAKVKGTKIKASCPVLLGGTKEEAFNNCFNQLMQCGYLNKPYSIQLKEI